MIAYKFRIYPTRKQEVQLEHTLNICRDLYNLALLDRKNTYEMEGISRSYEDQSKMLTLEKKNGNFDGIIVPKTLADRIHSCPNCGLEMDRDLNAALNIHTLGLRGRAYRDAVGSDL